MYYASVIDNVIVNCLLLAREIRFSPLSLQFSLVFKIPGLDVVR